jgi:hypothetical protein
MFKILLILKGNLKVAFSASQKKSQQQSKPLLLQPLSLNIVSKTV